MCEATNHVRAHGRAPPFKAGQTTETPKSYDRFVILAFRTRFCSFVAKMASQTQGIQQLLTAEKRAAEKVSDARKREFLSKHYNSYFNLDMCRA